MEIKEYLDSCLNKYFIEILNKNEFELTETNFSGLGGIYQFKNSWLNFEIINDRGIIETRVSSTFSNTYYDFDIINAHLNRRNKTEKEIEKQKFGKSDLSKRMNLEQESNLFENNISEIKTIFNKLNYKQTELELNAIGTERAKLLFG